MTIEKDYYATDTQPGEVWVHYKENERDSAIRMEHAIEEITKLHSGGGCSLQRTLLRTQFPANRELTDANLLPFMNASYYPCYCQHERIKIFWHWPFG